MRKSAYAKIGAFVCVATVLAAVAAVLMGAGSVNKKEVLFETYVEETVQGVSEGSAVKFRGIPVGTVKSVTFAMAKYGADSVRPGFNEAYNHRASRYARVIFAIDTTEIPHPETFSQLIQNQVDRGLRAHMKSQGITGLVYVDLDFEDPAKPTLPVPWEPEHHYIPSAPSLTKTLTDVVQNVAHEIHGLSDLRTEVSNLASRISLLIDNANKTLVSADATLLSANETLSGLPAIVAGASNAVADASAFLVAAKGGVAPLPSLMGGASNLVAEACRFLASVQDDVKEITVSSTNFLSGADATVSSPRAPLRNTLEDLSRTAKNLADMLDSIRDDPSRLFRRPAEENMP